MGVMHCGCLVVRVLCTVGVWTVQCCRCPVLSDSTGVQCCVCHMLGRCPMYVPLTVSPGGSCRCRSVWRSLSTTRCASTTSASSRGAGWRGRRTTSAAWCPAPPLAGYRAGLAGTRRWTARGELVQRFNSRRRHSCAVRCGTNPSCTFCPHRPPRRRCRRRRRRHRHFMLSPRPPLPPSLQFYTLFDVIGVFLTTSELVSG